MNRVWRVWCQNANTTSILSITVNHTLPNIHIFQQVHRNTINKTMRYSMATIFLVAFVLTSDHHVTTTSAFTTTTTPHTTTIRRHTSLLAPTGAQQRHLPFLLREKPDNIVDLPPPVAIVDSNQVVTDATDVTTTSTPVVVELSETQKLMQQVKDAGLAGVISYAVWELGFWAVSVPVVLIGYYEVTGDWPNLSDKTDLTKLSAEAFAFVNFARFAVPLRIGLALSTTPWIQVNVVDRFIKKGDANNNNTPAANE